MIIIIPILLLIVFGWIGASMAKAKGRDPALWALICVLFPVLGIIILAVSGSVEAGLNGSVVGVSATGKMSVGDTARWNTLVELDPDIAAAAATARQRGAAYEKLLATKYLTLNDKNYLSAALQSALDAPAQSLIEYNQHTLQGIVGDETKFRRNAGGDFSVYAGPDKGKGFRNMKALEDYYNS